MSRPSPIVERLLARVRKSGDFPAMAQTVGLISQLTSSEATSSSALSDTVLQDYGLTQKILRLVNTTAYAQYNQVTTITRAVLLMGFERIRNVATGLILFEHLQAQATTPALADALNMSFYSAILGRSIASRTGFVDPEEGFISKVPLTASDDLFVLSLHQQKDLVVKDTSSPDFAGLLPAWYRALLSSPRYVVLLPLVVEQKALGLFYVDGAASDSGKLTPSILNYLKVLRGQAVVAIRTKTASPQRRRP